VTSELLVDLFCECRSCFVVRGFVCEKFQYTNATGLVYFHTEAVTQWDIIKGILYCLNPNMSVSAPNRSSSKQNLNQGLRHRIDDTCPPAIAASPALEAKEHINVGHAEIQRERKLLARDSNWACLILRF